MRALVTGGTGFVGSHLVRLLLQEGYEVRVLTRSTSRLDNLQGLKVEKMTGDLKDHESLLRVCRDCQRVFHCAADYRLWAPNPQELYDNNVGGTENLLRACRECGVERTVVTSSVAAVGIPKDGTPGNEDTPVTIDDMIGDYKRSKFLEEQVAMQYAAEGDPIVVVNPSTPIGDHDIKPTATGQIITRFLNGGMPAYVDTGLNLVDVRDVARGHLLAAEKGRVGQRYILGGVDMTLCQILQELSRISGLKAPKVALPLWVAYMVGLCDTLVSTKLLHREPNVPLEGVKMARKHMFFSWEKAKNELGYQPGPVADALKRAVEWFKDNGYCHRSLPNYSIKA